MSLTIKNWTEGLPIGVKSKLNVVRQSQKSAEHQSVIDYEETNLKRTRTSLQYNNRINKSSINQQSGKTVTETRAATESLTIY